MSIVSLRAFHGHLLAFSLFFWFWALKNTVGMSAPNFDYGVVSFGTVIATSSYNLALANVKTAPGKAARYLALSSHVLVAFNYLLGGYLGFTLLERPGFGTYCIIFVGVWSGIGALGNRLAKNVESSNSENARLLV